MTHVSLGVLGMEENEGEGTHGVGISWRKRSHCCILVKAWRIVWITVVVLCDLVSEWFWGDVYQPSLSRRQPGGVE